jgi:low temperature requirement protein LtrA
VTTPLATPTRFRLVPMRPRDPGEAGRTASSLELFFDLVFVVAVSIAASEFHHGLTEGHVFDGLVNYGLVFFSIWWAWMNFTWFATSFATDDWLYRVLTFVQMGGVLVLAAGIGPAFAEGDYHVMVFSYLVMRIAMVAQWLRASRNPNPLRTTTRIYAAGIVFTQVFWLLQLTLSGPIHAIALLVLIAAELAIPVVAEKGGVTPWHPHHITERYGLFALILLGESLLGSANAIIEALHDDVALGPLISVSILTLVVTAALWWIYFWPPHHKAISSFANSLRYGYVHYFVFAAAGAFSAGIEVTIDALTGHTELGNIAASFTVTIPIAVFVLGIWLIAVRQYADRLVNTVIPAAVVLVLLDPILPIPFALTAIVLALVITVLVVRPAPTPGD